MMSKNSKQELTKEIQPRYLKENKAEKKRILDEYAAATGYHRKNAIKLLKHGLKRKGNKKVGRKKVYQGEVVDILKKIWGNVAFSFVKIWVLKIKFYQAQRSICE